MPSIFAEPAQGNGNATVLAGGGSPSIFATPADTSMIQPTPQSAPQPQTPQPTTPQKGFFQNITDTLGGFARNVAGGAKELFGDVKTAITTPPQTQSYISGVKNTFNDAVEQVNRNADEFGSGNLLQKSVAVGDTAFQAVNVLFSPISAAFASSEVAKVPVLGKLANGVNRLFSAVGAGASDAAEGAVDSLPISQQNKDTILPLAKEVSALLSQIYAGKLGGDAVNTVVSKAKNLAATVSNATVNHVQESVPQATPPATEPSIFNAPEAKAATPAVAPLAPETGAGATETAKVGETAPAASNAPLRGKSGEVAGIPKDLQPFAQEAQKYKSAEEFVKAVKNNTILTKIADTAVREAPQKDLYFADLGRIGTESTLDVATAEARAKKVIDTFRKATDTKITNEDVDAEVKRLYKEGKDNGFAFADKPISASRSRLERQAVINLASKNVDTFRLNRAVQLTDFFNKVKSAEKTGTPARTTPLGKSQQFQTVHQGGEIKTVAGRPVRLVDGVQTFVHKTEEGGFAVSEKSTSRQLAQDTTVKGAIAKAKTNIENAGEDKFRKLIEENKLSTTESIRVPEAQEKPQPSITLQSGLNPNLDVFIEQDLKPAFKTLSSGAIKTVDILKKIFAPTTRGEVSAKTASILRKNLGRSAARTERVFETLKKSRGIFDRYTKQQALDFIDNLETGKPNKGAEAFTTAMRDALDTRWNIIKSIKGTDAYIENYFPHIWKDPAKATEILQGVGKRPFEGTKSFLKPRTIPTIKEGVGLGLEPASFNPVDLIMARVSDMDRFIMAHDTWTEFKKEGLVKFVRTGGDIPTGWIKVNDRISTSFQFSPEEKGLVLRGGYYMPEQGATVLNNYLSPGLSGNPLYDAARMSGNTLNQVQLGVSTFHAFFTSVDAIVSKAALDVLKVFAPNMSIGERLSAGGRFIASPITAPYVLWENLTRGNALLKDYFAKNPQMPALVDSLERAGGRVRMDKFYFNDAVQNFMRAVRSENYIGATFRAPGAFIEALAKPLMQEFVPRQKLGVFADGAQFILQQAERGGWSEAKTTLRLQEYWDSVDNRMGQLVYDNLFWNKTLKDTGMISVRSLGWNIGDIREIPGGIRDLAKIPIQATTAKGRANIRVTPKLGYIFALPYLMGVYGAVINYLYTGKPPEEPLDYFYPKTGKTKLDGTPERITLPSYMKDVFAYKTEPLQTVKNKLHPEASALADMLQNKDYYGTEIRNPNDPIVKQMEDLVAFQLKQFVPFSITNLLQRQKAGGSWASYLQSFGGITPAPGYITRTPLQTRITELYDKRFGGGTQTAEQKNIQQQKTDVRTLYLQGKTEEANAALKKLVEMGIVKNPDSFVKEADIPFDVKLFTRLPPEDQKALLKDMQLYELGRYSWYANKDVKTSLSSLSDNAKSFVQLVKDGEAKQPVWKKGQLVQTPQ